MENWRGNRHFCGSIFIDDCTCGIKNVDNLKMMELKPLCSICLHPNEVVEANCSNCSNSDGNSEKFKQKQKKTSSSTRRELRSFSHPAINFIFTRENRVSNINKKDQNNLSSHQESNQLNNQVNLDHRINNINGQKRDMKLQFKDFESIDKAQQFFAESGILGPTSLSSSHDFLKQTSTIHLDTILKGKIRKTSLCLLSKTFGEKYSPSISPASKISFKDSNELIVEDIQRQIYSLKGIIETGETKIVMLRAEVNKIKRMLLELMYASSHNKSQLHMESPILCVFCQEEAGFSRAMLKVKQRTM